MALWNLTDGFILANNRSWLSMSGHLYQLLLCCATTRLTGMPGHHGYHFCDFFFANGYLLVLLSPPPTLLWPAPVFYQLRARSLESTAFSYCWFLTAWFFSFSLTSSIWAGSSMCWERWMFLRWVRAPTSSSTSMALSGRKRSVMYLFTQFYTGINGRIGVVNVETLSYLLLIQSAECEWYLHWWRFDHYFPETFYRGAPSFSMYCLYSSRRVARYTATLILPEPA